MVPQAEAGKIATLMTDLKIASMLAELRGLPRGTELAQRKKAINALGARFAGMLGEGVVPGERNASAFYSYIMRHAEAEKNVKLGRKALAGYKKLFGDKPRYSRSIEFYEKRLAKLEAEFDGK
ncbi:MAG: hypothetical protein ACE5F1_17870 [Planctomycetota bacterium]